MRALPSAQSAGGGTIQRPTTISCMEHGRYIIDLHLNKIGNAYIEFFNIIDMNKLVTRFIAIIAAIATLFVTKAVGAEREYLPILEDGKSWVMVEKRIPMKPGEKDTAYYDVMIVGDITINDKVCKKVSIVERDGEESWGTNLYEENGKLFIASKSNMALLLDMSCEKGDKLDIFIGPSEVYPDTYLEIIDSRFTTASDGLERKVLDVRWGDWMESGVWIEGIGCDGDSWPLLFPETSNGRWVEMYIDSCMKDGEVLFTRADFEQLLGKYSGRDKVRPTEPLTLTYSEDAVSAVCDGKEISLELYSLEGKLIGRTRSSDKAVLETSALPGGIYIAKAICGETSAVRKIVL